MKTNRLRNELNKYLTSVEDANEEVHAAQAIQQMLLQDEVPLCDSLLCKGVSIPADRLSGDYYDFIYDQDAGRYWVLVGDVMGKGIPAALMMVMLRSAVRSLVHFHSTPGELLHTLNNTLHSDLTRLGAFVTLFCGVYNVRERRFSYASAGHPSPLLLKQAEDQAQKLEVKGTIIGVLKNRTYNNYSIPLSQGDLLLICTDGVLESMGAQKQQYGYAKLGQIMQTHRNTDLCELLQLIVADVNQYAEEIRKDDVTLVAVRMTDDGE